MFLVLLFTVFLLLSGIFCFLFQSHSALCSFKKQAKPAQLKAKNTAKVIFRTCLELTENIILRHTKV